MKNFLEILTLVEMMNFNENTVFFAVLHHGIFVSFAAVVVFVVGFGI